MPQLLKIRYLLMILPVMLFLIFGQQSLSAEVSISIGIAPPALPIYVQPPCPVAGYMWVPGYWAWSPDGYYWVPGVWVQPPSIGVLWTPGYWGFANGAYVWHAGYWGPHVGFYGGINYGFGYTGVGYWGGNWIGSTFRYNTAVTNVNRTVVRNVYVDRTVIRNTTIVNRVSYNGQGGVTARPTMQERAFSNERHVQPTASQVAHFEAARQDRSLLAYANHGRPAVAAMDTVNGRRFDQQGRIASGVASGQLTAGETRRLENRETNLNHEIRSDRRANGGGLTSQQRQQVDQQQNNLSRSIYDDKHNAATAHYGDNRVDNRRAEQQQRIAQGINNGQLTPREAAHAERTQQQINQRVNAERRANQGSLTQQERRQLNREQNHASGQIRQERHNGPAEH